MRQISLLDLPDEVIIYIIECLPEEVINRLKDVPELRLNILRVLYKEVTIIPPNIYGDGIYMMFHSESNMSIRTPGSEQIDIKEFITSINDNTVEIIKKATFTDPSHLFMVYEKYPEVLKNIKIIVDFDSFRWDREMDKNLIDFKRLAELPYEIIGLHSVNEAYSKLELYDSEDDDSENDLENDSENNSEDFDIELVSDEEIQIISGREMEEYPDSDLDIDMHEYQEEDNDIEDSADASDFNADSDIELETNSLDELEDELNGSNDGPITDWVENEIIFNNVSTILTQVNFVMQFSGFSHLTSLLIKHLYGPVLKVIPKGVVDLKIDEFCFIGARDGTSFPEGLKSLAILKLTRVQGFSADPVDISYLENLETFKCEYSREFVLPKNLQSLEASDSINLRQIISECPSIKSIKCFDLYDKDCVNEEVSLPNDLEVLEIMGDYIKYMTKYQLEPFKTSHVINVEDEKDAAVVVKFPEMLKKLKLQYEPDDHAYENVQVFLNRPETTLNHLTSLCLSDYENGLYIGPLPQSLQYLFIDNSTGVDYDDLKTLNNLTYLDIMNVNLTEFDYDLPDNLREFRFRNNHCEVFKIRAKNLDYLEVEGVLMDKLNGSNFQVPESVTTLSIEYSEIQEIDSSFKFPPNLRQLSLAGNKLSVLPQLPSSLLRLSLRYNRFSELKTPIDLPPNIEGLDLSCNDLPDDFNFAHLNLTKYTKLKTLLLREYEREEEGNIPIFDLSDLPKSLVELNLSECKIQRIVGNLSDFPHLEKLDLRSNNNNDNSITELLNIKEDPLEYPYFPDSLKHLWITRSLNNDKECEIIDKILKVVLKKPNIISVKVTDEYTGEDGVITEALKLYSPDDF